MSDDNPKLPRRTAVSAEQGPPGKAPETPGPEEAAPGRPNPAGPSDGRPYTREELQSLVGEISGHFPASYDRTELVLLDVDPHHLHAYWNIRQNDLAKALREVGPGGPQGPMLLRLRELVPGAEAGQPGGGEVFDLAVHGLRNRWYVDVWQDGATYEAALGLRGANGTIVWLAHSAPVTTPRSGQSADYEFPKIDVPTAETTLADLPPGVPAERARLDPRFAPMFPLAGALLPLPAWPEAALLDRAAAAAADATAAAAIGEIPAAAAMSSPEAATPVPHAVAPPGALGHPMTGEAPPGTARLPAGISEGADEPEMAGEIPPTIPGLAEWPAAEAESGEAASQGEGASAGAEAGPSAPEPKKPAYWPAETVGEPAAPDIAAGGFAPEHVAPEHVAPEHVAPEHVAPEHVADELISRLATGEPIPVAPPGAPERVAGLGEALHRLAETMEQVSEPAGSDAAARFAVPGAAPEGHAAAARGPIPPDRTAVFGEDIDRLAPPGFGPRGEPVEPWPDGNLPDETEPERAANGGAAPPPAGGEEPLPLESIMSLSSFAFGREDVALEVNAEVHIYGRARPGAKLTMFGQRLRLLPDGSFSIRRPLPHGSLVLPILMAQGMEMGEGGGDD